MPAGNIVGYINEIQPPKTDAATQDTRDGGSTPNEVVHVWDFDAAGDEYLDFKGVLNGYDGGGLKVRIHWMASVATSGDVRWGAAFRRIQDDAEDIDEAHTYAFNYVIDAAPSASGEFGVAEIDFTDGADMDSLLEGEPFILRVVRDADHGDDDMTGDAELVLVEVIEG